MAAPVTIGLFAFTTLRPKRSAIPIDSDVKAP
jgi:hypothetical protein